MERGGGASEGAACFTGADDDRDSEVRLVNDQSLQELHVESLVQFLPLHLVHVGCGSLTTGDMCAPHLRPSTPGQSLLSRDDMTQLS